MLSYKNYLTETKKQSISMDKLVPWQQHHTEEGVKRYQEKLKDGKKIAPIKVIPHDKDTEKYSIVDGHHRYIAHKREGRTHIDAHIYKRLADVPSGKK